MLDGVCRHGRGGGDGIVKVGRRWRQIDIERVARERPAFGEPGRPDAGDGHSAEFLQVLHRDPADRAEGSRNQDPIAPLDAEEIDRLPAGERDERQRCAGLEGYIRRKLRDPGHGRRRHFGIAALAVERHVRDHPVTDREFGHARPDRDDRPRRVDAEDRRKLQGGDLGEQSLPHDQVDGVEAGHFDLDQSFAGPRNGIGRVLVAELVDVAIGLKTDSFHDLLTPRFRTIDDAHMAPRRRQGNGRGSRRIINNVTFGKREALTPLLMRLPPWRRATRS